jgi:hypothetical protein
MISQQKDSVVILSASEALRLPAREILRFVQNDKRGDSFG